MRILFTICPGSGHLYPLVPIAKALNAAGHEIVFAAPTISGPEITASGFRFFPAGMDNEQYAASIAPARARAPDRRAFSELHSFPGVRAARMLPDLLVLAENWLPDLVVWDNLAFAGAVAAEHWG